ncbi:MAG: histone deacetylase family protein [Chloroflexota bacterium]
MSKAVAYIYHEVYDGRGFSRLHDSWRRYRLACELLAGLGFFDNGLRHYRQEPASDDDLTLVHSPKFVEFVRRMDAAGEGVLDYGDTPAYRGVLRRAQLAVGGTMLAADLVWRGEVAHSFNPGGGLHHARADAAGGFCVFNDVAVATRRLQRNGGAQRIAVLDCDGHHGDGTQSIFYGEPLLTISLHRFDGRFYPRSGRAEEWGEGRGTGYNLNLPLPRGAGDEAFLLALREGALARLYAYRPQVIFLQIGADGHHQDPLVRLGLSLHAYEEMARLVHQAAHELCGGKLVLVAGGGYRPESVVRCWAVFLANLAGIPPQAADTLRNWIGADQPPASSPEAVAGVVTMLDELRQRGALGEPSTDVP